MTDNDSSVREADNCLYYCSIPASVSTAVLMYLDTKIICENSILYSYSCCVGFPISILHPLNFLYETVSSTDSFHKSLQ